MMMNWQHLRLCAAAAGRGVGWIVPTVRSQRPMWSYLSTFTTLDADGKKRILKATGSPLKISPLAAMPSSLSAAVTQSSLSLSSSSSPSPVKLFEEDLNIIYDSKCNICKLEIDFLRRRDRARAISLSYSSRNTATGKLKFTDLEGVETGPYNPQDPANAGIDYPTALATMHAVTQDGRILTGVPVFRAAYQAVGLGWLFALTTWPGIQQVSNWLYKLFAAYRTNLTRGATQNELVQLYHEKQRLESLKQAKDQCKTCQSSSQL